jgi:chloramphenicol-sensitive protein RarD
MKSSDIKVSGLASEIGRNERETTTGVLFAVGAYSWWGLLSLYFFALQPAGAPEIVANRVIWSLVFCALLIAGTRSWNSVPRALRTTSILVTLAIAAGLIAVNWLAYAYGVISGQAVEASLGYFINPLVSVLLGVLVLKERLRPLQWAALAIGLVAVVVLTVSYGKPPWIALILAISFGLYGYVKKRVGPDVGAITSLTIETMLLAPLAAAAMIVFAVRGTATLASGGPAHLWLLIASGVITTIPLLFFGAAARRLPLTTIGLLQYFAPLLQFVVALVVFKETMTTERWVGFVIVWLSLLILALDMFQATRKESPLRRSLKLPSRS